MASPLKDLLQRFTFWAAGIALVAVLVLASFAGRAATRTLERLADQRGAEVAGRATALVANYVRERHGEADQLAANPFLIRAAVEAARSVVVLEGVYPLDRVGWLLTGINLGDSAYLQLVDKRGNLLYGPAQTQLRDVPRDRVLYDPDRPGRAILRTARGPELIVSVPAARGRFPANEAYYWVLFREPTAVAYAMARAVQRYVWLGAVALVALAVGMMVWLGRWLNARVAAPV